MLYFFWLPTEKNNELFPVGISLGSRHLDIFLLSLGAFIDKTNFDCNKNERCVTHHKYIAEGCCGILAFRELNSNMITIIK